MTRVAITTDRFDDVVADYEKVGLEPVALPCIRVEHAATAEIARARRRLQLADLVLVTSARVVNVLWPERGAPDVDFAAVGPATARAVRHAGGRVRFVGDSGLHGLVESVTDRLRHGLVAIARAEGTDPVGLSSLRERTSRLEEHVVYRTEPVAPGPEPVGAVAFASPSSVAGWSHARRFDDVVIGVIGATTAKAVAAHRNPDVVAAQPSHSALARDIAAFMEVKL